MAVHGTRGIKAIDCVFFAFILRVKEALVFARSWCMTGLNIGDNNKSLMFLVDVYVFGEVIWQAFFSFYYSNTVYCFFPDNARELS